MLHGKRQRTELRKRIMIKTGAVKKKKTRRNGKKSGEKRVKRRG